ncbi:hypothetical protein CsSME_00044332 [Camellia sinensis var. sinensis]
MDERIVLMDDKTCHPVPRDEETLVVRSIREMPPAHYTFKINSFSLLSTMLTRIGEEKHESDSFEAGGYLWRLSVYPYGRKERNADGYISLYLVIAETNTLPLGWEVNVIFKLFVYDQIQDKYLTFQADKGRVNRFHGMKTECGFAQLLSLNTFNNASNGYLINDSCIFGAEVFVVKCTGKGECVSMVTLPDDNIFTWRIENFSTLFDEKYLSEAFTSGEHIWKLSINPRGVSNHRGEYLALNIHLVDHIPLPPGRKLYVEYRLCIRDQIHGQHEELTDNSWFAATVKSWTYKKFLLMTALLDPSRGFLLNDTLIVEGQIKVVSVVRNFS